MKAVLEIKETYRIDTEEEVQRIIKEEKEKAVDEGYILKGYSSKIKEKKSKGEVIDCGYEVIFIKEYNLTKYYLERKL